MNFYEQLKTVHAVQLLGAFTKNCEKRLLASSYQSVYLSFLLSVRLEKLGSHWTDFYANSYLSVYENLLRQFKFHYNPTKNNAHSTSGVVKFF
jgi:hypothetical protein